MRPYFLAFLRLLLLPSVVWCADPKWPEIKEVAVSFPVDLDAEKVEIDLPLSDKAGKVQYVFWCRNGNERYLAGQGEKLGVDFLISFTCGLNSAANVSSGALLTEDDAPIWHT